MSDICPECGSRLTDTNGAFFAAELARAEVALAKYARHLDGCDLNRTRTWPTCTCGLRRALEKP